MSAADTVSVVIPCYNASAWIEGSLASVYDQGWTDLEVLVVDDGSRDDSVERVRARFPSARIVQQANAGVAAARNAGIRAATGRWVAFLDADDIWLPGKLREQMALFASQPDARMGCTGWMVWVSNDRSPSPEVLEEATKLATEPRLATAPSGWIYPELLLSCSVWTSTVVAERSLLLELGAFDRTLKIGEDYDLWLRASRVTPILRVRKPLALYRQHPNSLTRQAPAANYEAAVVEQALRRWGYDSPDGRRADPAQVARSLARTWHAFGSASLEAGQVRPAWRSARQALRLDWRWSGAWKLAARTMLRAAGVGRA